MPPVARGRPRARGGRQRVRRAHDLELPSLVVRDAGPPSGSTARVSGPRDHREHRSWPTPSVPWRSSAELAPSACSCRSTTTAPGYSCLAHLKRLPISELRSTRALSPTWWRNSSDAVITASTIDLARRLGLRVVAEGVESEATWRQLRGWAATSPRASSSAGPSTRTRSTAWMEEHQRDGRRSHALDPRWRRRPPPRPRGGDPLLGRGRHLQQLRRPGGAPAPDDLVAGRGGRGGTLSESSRPSMGMRTSTSQRSRTRRDSPLPSAPSTRQSGPAPSASAW